MLSQSIDRKYKGFTISGNAQPVAMDDTRWFAVGGSPATKEQPFAAF
jgi:hypothetical protein